MPKRVWLVPINGSEPVELTRELTLCGRKEECDLFVDHKSVSKMHCIISRDGDTVHVRDLGSTNGTRINGKRVRRGSVVHQDQLNVANVGYRLQVGRVDPVSPEDRTVQVNAKDLEEYNATNAKAQAMVEIADVEPSAPAIQNNALPDELDTDDER